MRALPIHGFIGTRSCLLQADDRPYAKSGFP
jgi:hypothetical protein